MEEQMVRNYWITKDYYDKNVNVNFAEPTLYKYNIFLHMLTEEKLAELEAKLIEGNDFVLEDEMYKLVVKGNKTDLKLMNDVSEYIYTDLISEVVTEYNSEVKKMNEELDGNLSK
jgi:hypothetical protein